MFVHGLIDSADSFIMNHRNKSHPFVLSDAGYDVWLPNSRGNKYSNQHTVLNPDTDLEYWDHAKLADIA